MKKSRFFTILLVLCGYLLIYNNVSAQNQVVTTDTIYTLEDLQWLSENPSAWGDNWVLGANIDASETASWNNGQGLSPIGDSPTEFGVRQQIPFTGTFDGQGYEISNITINRPDEPYVGFFGQVISGAVENLKLTQLSVEGYRYVGGMIGYAQDTSIISNCSVEGDVVGYEIVGGLIGEVYRSNEISECHTSGSVTTTMWGGGISGDLYTYSTITNCYSYCEINGSNYLGGISGSNRWYSSINYSYATGDVYGTGDYIGGLVGNNDDGVVNTCFATGDATGNEVVGGLAGSSIMGQNLETGIYYSYATGQVNANAFVGGVVGLSYAYVTDCYYDSETTGTTVGIGNPDAGQFATDLTTDEFANEDNFLNWDFADTWTIYVDDMISASLRPYLNWQYTELHTLNFASTEGGTIEGAATQLVFPGSNSAAVNAVALDGYFFVRWQDASGNQYSTDETLVVEDVMADASYTAVFDVAEYYGVTFIVTDGNTPMEGASITIDGNDLITDINGTAVINLGNGDYSYTVDLEGYLSFSGNITVAGNVVNVDVILTPDNIQEKSAFDLNLYPNPNNGVFHIEATGLFNVSVLDLTGKSIYIAQAEDKASIDISNYPSGIYLVKLESNKEVVTVKLMVK